MSSTDPRRVKCPSKCDSKRSHSDPRIDENSSLRKSEQDELDIARRLATSAGHEIKNTVEALTTLLYVIHDDPALSEISRRNLLLANEQMDHLRHVVNLMLGFYRQSYCPTTLRISALLDNTLNLYASNIARKHLNVEKEYASQCSVRGFEPELRQVFSNAIVNAIQSVPNGGTIKIRISAPNNWRGVETASVVISDDGGGIAPEYRQNLFKPFFTTKHQGTGLGLWLSRRIVEKHGGSIRLRSSILPGQSGTVLRICLPLSSKSLKVGT